MCWMHISTTNHSKTKIIVSTWHVINIITTKYVSQCPIGMCWRLIIIAKQGLMSPLPMCWTWSYRGDLRVQLACTEQYHHKGKNHCVFLAGVEHYHHKTEVILSSWHVPNGATSRQTASSTSHVLNIITAKQKLLCQITMWWWKPS